jgi:hypothetical protein
LASVPIDRTAVRAPSLGVRAVNVLAALHRYVGTALCVVFLAWFASGIVMMYAGYPLLGEQEKLERTPPLEVTSALLPHEAWRSAGGVLAPSHVRIVQREGEPVYVFATRGDGWVSVAAADGRVLPPLTASAAERSAAQFAPSAGRLQYAGLRTEPDQWTMFALWAPYMSDYSFAPFHKFAAADPAGTEISVLASTGDVVQETTRRERFWGYVGAVVHWIYPTILRRNAAAWADVVVWTSGLGTALCLTGVVIGLVRLRWRRAPRAAGSPYRGWLKWHHYIGLVFGTLACTWVFSGLLSMDPWGWSLTDDTPDGSHQEVMRGGELDLAAFTAAPAGAVAACNAELATKELRLVQLRGEPFYWCVESPRRSLLVSARAGQNARPVAQLAAATLTVAARALAPGHSITESSLLEDYDAYYYPGWYDKLVNGASKRLPVLRVRFDDPSATTVYIDPYSASPVLAYDTSARWFRWLFHGLHSFDFGGLYRSRPLWDVIVLPLLLGGVLLSGTGVWVGFKWLARKWRMARRSVPG